MSREQDVLRPPQDPSSFLSIAPEIHGLAEIEFVTLLNKDSTNMVPSDWSAMANAIHDRLDLGFGGFVVIHGTDTMHHSASALAFAFGSGLNVPVVFTGAQTDASVLHGDARINLIRAVRVALEPIAEVVIAFGDYVYRGSRAQKCDRRLFRAFESPAVPPVATISEKILLHPSVHRVTPEQRPLDFRPSFDADIVQVTLIPGLKPSLMAPLLESSSLHGIVLQCYGAGNVPDFEEYSFLPFIEEAFRRNIPLIITSQFSADSTDDSSYEPGVKAIQAGAIPTGNMTGAAAAVKFRWILSLLSQEIHSRVTVSSDKIARVKALMATPYVDEMD